jgi:hypothetical protein
MGIGLKKTQSIGEYLILLSAITLALMGMRTYLKRGIQSVVGLQAAQMSECRQWFFKLDPNKGFTINASSQTLKNITRNVTEDNSSYTLNSSNFFSRTGNSLYWVREMELE